MLIAQIVRFTRPHIQIYDAHLVDLYQWVWARVVPSIFLAMRDRLDRRNGRFGRPPCARTGQSHDRITARPAFTQKRARLPAEEISLSKSFPTNASRYLYFPQHETFVLAVYW